MDLEKMGMLAVNEKPMVDSRTVAEKFDKRHDNILRDIENLECSEEFRRLNFEESSYVNAQNKPMPCYQLTRDGFTFLAMGFTGKEAALWKEKYIKAFNLMEKEIYNRLSPAEQMMRDALRLREYELRMEKVEERLDMLDGDSGYCTVLAYARRNKIYLPRNLASKAGKFASKQCEISGIPVGRVADERWGEVNSYPVMLLEQIFKDLV